MSPETSWGWWVQNKEKGGPFSLLPVKKWSSSSWHLMDFAIEFHGAQGVQINALRNTCFMNAVTTSGQNGKVIKQYWKVFSGQEIWRLSRYPGEMTQQLRPSCPGSEFGWQHGQGQLTPLCSPAPGEPTPPVPTDTCIQLHTLPTHIHTHS